MKLEILSISSLKSCRKKPRLSSILQLFRKIKDSYYASSSVAAREVCLQNMPVAVPLDPRGSDMRTSFLRLLPSVTERSCHIRGTLFLPFRSQVCFGTFHRSGQDHFRPDLCFEALPIQSCLPSFLHGCDVSAAS